MKFALNFASREMNFAGFANFAYFEVFLAFGGNFRCCDTSSAPSFRAGHYKDLTETGNRARKVSDTQGTIVITRASFEWLWTQD